MIGLFDESNVIDALLPACLKNGANPGSFNTGSVPLYTGQQGAQRTTTMTNFESPYGYDAITGSLKFDGVNDTLCLSAHALGGLAQVSFSCWCVVSKNSSTIYGEWATATIWRFCVVVNSIGNLLFITRSSGITNIASVTSIEKDILHHIVVVFDSVGSTQKIYVDGALAATINIAGVIADANTSGVLPCYGFSEGNPLGGAISGGVLFKSALTVEQIATLYTLSPDLGGLKLYTDGRLVAPSSRRRKQSRPGFKFGFGF